MCFPSFCKENGARLTDATGLMPKFHLAFSQNPWASWKLDDWTSSYNWGVYHLICVIVADHKEIVAKEAEQQKQSQGKRLERLPYS